MKNGLVGVGLLVCALLGASVIGAPATSAAAIPSLSGVVTDSVTHQPIPGVPVRVTEIVHNDNESPEFGKTVYTDSQGYYSCELPWAHTYIAYTDTVRGYGMGDTYFTFNGVDPVGIDFALDPLELKVTGTITDAVTGSPLGGVFVQAMTEDETEQRWAHSDSNGFYEIWMPFLSYTGPYKMRTELWGYRDANRFDIAQVDTKLPTQDFALEPAPPIVADEFEPDDSLAGANSIAPDGAAQVRTFFPKGDSDWIRIDAIAGLTYAIRTFDTLMWRSGPAMQLYQGDGVTPIESTPWRGYGTPGWYMQYVIEWTANATAPVYVHVTNRSHSNDVSSPGCYGIYVETNPPVAGIDRYETSVFASKRAFPDGAETVVVATGQNWPDALGGTALAGVVDGPILLVKTGGAPQSVLSEIDRLGASKVYVLGSETAVGPAVINQLRALPKVTDVERIDGTNRYETANRIAERVVELLGPEYDGGAFVTTGANFPDALAAAPLAAASGVPLFMADPRSGLSAQTLAAMSDVDHAIILGSTDAVSNATQSQVTRTLGTGATVERISGRNRYETAANIASYGVRVFGLSWDRAGVSSGQRFPDALSGGVAQGEAGSVMLLTNADSLSVATESVLRANSGRIGTVTFYGGDTALSKTVRSTVRGLLN